MAVKDRQYLAQNSNGPMFYICCGDMYSMMCSERRSTKLFQSFVFSLIYTK